MTKQRLGNVLALTRLAMPYLAFVVLRRWVPLETLTRWAWRPAERARNHVDERLVAARVARLSQLITRGADCLPRSLLLYRELSRRGADPRLVIGFADASRPFVGHAWVTIDGQPLGETASMLAPLTSVCVFGARGRVLDAQ